MPYLDPPENAGPARRVPFTPNAAALIVFLGAGGAGAALVAVGLKLAPVAGLHSGARGPVALFGACLLAASGLLGARTLGYVRQRLALARFAQPWRRDHPWDLRGSLDDGPGRRGLALAGLTVFGLLLGLLNWALVGGVRGVSGLFLVFPWLIVGGFDLVFAVMAISTVLDVARGRRYGRTGLRFDRPPPFCPGGEFVGAFLGLPELARASRLEAELRCVRERVLRDGPSDDLRTEAVILFRERLTLAADASGEAPISFVLPAEGPGTDLSGPGPWVFWEVAVRADMPGPDFEAVYLLPVYEPDKTGQG